MNEDSSKKCTPHLLYCFLRCRRIAAFAFSAWAGLAALYREAQRRAKAENELAQLKLVAEEMEEIRYVKILSIVQANVVCV